MIKIDIKTIPHGRQRYDTVGDWYFEKPQGANDTLHLIIRVSEMNNPYYEALVAHHELTEALLCHSAGITDEIVTKHDISCAYDEPGDDPSAPYHDQHLIASLMERTLADKMGVNWNEYDLAVFKLGN